MNPVARICLLPLALSAFAAAQTGVSWSQAGGAFAKAPGLAGIVSQGYGAEVSSFADGVLQSGFLAHPLLVNSGPFVSAPLDDRALAQGDSLSLDLGRAFVSFDGNELGYSVEGCDAAVTCAISGATLRVSSAGLPPGEARIVTTASDGTLQARDTFLVVVSIPVATSGRAARSGSRRISADVRTPFSRGAAGLGKAALGVEDAECREGRCQEIEIAVSGPAQVSVAIFDQLGVPVNRWEQSFSSRDVRRLEAGADGRPRVVVRWNLRAANGAAVAPGVYLWRIEVRGDDGQEFEAVRRTGVR